MSRRNDNRKDDRRFHERYNRTDTRYRSFTRPKKALGQNFLRDEGVADDICKSSIIKDKVVVEVGAGEGFLTKEIIKYKPKKLILIEKDSRLIENLHILQSTFEGECDVSIMNIDALNLSLTKLSEQFHKKITIVANLPYNVGTTLVVNWLRYLSNINEIVVMLQKEVVDRIVANSKTGDYGRISVLIQSMCETQKLFDVSRECFYPKPNVTSSVVKIVPKKKILSLREYSVLDFICRVFFSHRRKIISNILKKTEYERFRRFLVNSSHTAVDDVNNIDSSEGDRVLNDTDHCDKNESFDTTIDTTMNIDGKHENLKGKKKEIRKETILMSRRNGTNCGAIPMKNKDDNDIAKYNDIVKYDCIAERILGCILQDFGSKRAEELEVNEYVSLADMILNLANNNN